MSDAIPGYFVFTTATGSYDFDLATIISQPTTDSFSGTGTFVDDAGVLANTPGTFTASFSGPHSYSFSLSAVPVSPVPEPSTIGLLALGSVGAFTMRRRKA